MRNNVQRRRASLGHDETRIFYGFLIDSHDYRLLAIMFTIDSHDIADNTGKHTALASTYYLCYWPPVISIICPFFFLTCVCVCVWACFFTGDCFCTNWWIDYSLEIIWLLKMASVIIETALTRCIYKLRLFYAAEMNEWLAGESMQMKLIRNRNWSDEFTLMLWASRVRSVVSTNYSQSKMRAMQVIWIIEIIINEPYWRFLREKETRIWIEYCSKKHRQDD